MTKSRSERIRLAAAAPSLLSALKQCLLILDDSDYGEDHSLREATDAARAVIKKATES